jgi:hypothetical protein
MASYIGVSPPRQNGIINRFRYTATGGQTAFTGADANGSSLFYTSNNAVLVFLNGVQLVEGVDFTKTSDTVLTLASGATANDVLEILSFGAFSLQNDSATRSLLGLGTVATLNVGTSASNIPQLNGSGKLVDDVFPATLPAVSGANLTNLPAETKPTITGISPSTITNAQTAITITGTNFVSVPTVEAVSSTGAITHADAVSFTSATSISATFTLSVDGTYFIRVENNDGNAVRSSSALLTVSDAPTWTTSAGSLGTIAGNFSGTVATVAATGDGTLSFSETTNVLTNASQANCSLNSSTGAITTTDFGGSSTSATTYSFTLRVTDAQGQTADRAFSLTSSFALEDSGRFTP